MAGNDRISQVRTGVNTGRQPRELAWSAVHVCKCQAEQLRARARNLAVKTRRPENDEERFTRNVLLQDKYWYPERHITAEQDRLDGALEWFAECAELFHDYKAQSVPRDPNKAAALYWRLHGEFQTAFDDYQKNCSDSNAVACATARLRVRHCKSILHEREREQKQRREIINENFHEARASAQRVLRGNPEMSHGEER